jgi:TP901 family phage tail tape measure protein
MPARTVEYIITADTSGATDGMLRVQRKMVETGNSVEKFGSRMKSMGSSMVSFGHSMASISLPIAAVGVIAIKSSQQFQKSMDLLQTQAKLSATEVKGLEKGILKLSPKQIASPEELAAAMYPIASVGLKGARGLAALNAASKGAQISGASLTETASGLSSVLVTNLGDIHSASEAMSVLNQTVGAGKLKLEDVNQALATGILPQAKASGLGLRDVGSAMSAMARQGIPASVEMTRLRLNLTQITESKGAALKALGSIGLSQYQLANDLRKPEGLVTALKDLRTHLHGLSQDEQNNILGRAFGGAKGSANIIGLLQSLPEMEAIRKSMNVNGEKALNQAFGTTQAESANKMKEALNGLKTALIQLGGVLTPIVIPAMEKIVKDGQKAGEWFAKLPKPLRDVGVAFAIALGAASPLLIVFGNLFKVGGSVIGVLGKLVTVNKQLAFQEGAAAGAAGAEEGAGAGGAALGLTGAGAGVLGGLSVVGGFLGLAHLVKGAKEGLHQTTISQNSIGGGGSARFSPAMRAEMKREESENTRELEAAKKRSAKEIEATNVMPPIVIHLHHTTTLDGKVVAENTASHVRNNPSSLATKHITEAVGKHIQNVQARNP